jgi:hypothetical protein
VAKILITQDSDPYVEASQFCARHGLKSAYITVIGDAIAAQMALEQHSKTVQNAEHSHPASSQTGREKKSETLECHTMQTELKEEP